jgi:nickel/cobalt exporter
VTDRAWRLRVLIGCALAVGAIIIAHHGLDAAFAQTGPFGRPRGPVAPPPEGLTGWILAKQAEFYRALSGLVRDTKADGSAAWALFGVSFLYGVFHAAGPGHGKAVISSYLVANEETWRRGVTLSFASSLLQALAAVAIVGVAAAIIGVTSRRMTETVQWIEIASYGLIALLGVRLTYQKGRDLIAAWREQRAAHAYDNNARGDSHESRQHDHDDDHHHHSASDHRHNHAHRDHAHHDHTGHAHGPELQELVGPGGWRRGLAAVFAVGLRPCSGAILVLVFALAQGLFWAGVVATFVMGLGTAITVTAIATLAVGAKSLARRLAKHRDSGGALVLRGVELAAAIGVLALGLALLAGYMASERMAF